MENLFDIEIWRGVKGFEGLYEVSNLGNVRSLDRDRTDKGRSYCGNEKKPTQAKSGYCYIGFSKNGEETKTTVHRLVATAFIPNPENKRTVNHINGNKTDNRAENLEWCTQKENNRHAWASGLCTPKKRADTMGPNLKEWQVIEIRKKLDEGVSCMEITRTYRTKRSNVYAIKYRTNWKHI